MYLQCCSLIKGCEGDEDMSAPVPSVAKRSVPSASRLRLQPEYKRGVSQSASVAMERHVPAGCGRKQALRDLGSNLILTDSSEVANIIFLIERAPMPSGVWAREGGLPS